MSDDEQHDATRPGTGEPQQPVEATASEPRPDSTDWKARSREWERRAKANADAAAKLAALEEAAKSDEQRRSEALSAAERERDAARLELVRMRVIAETQLDPDLHEFVSATDEDEMRRQAAKLKARYGAEARDPAPAAAVLPGPRPDLSQGARGSAALNGDQLRQAIEQKLGIR